MNQPRREKGCPQKNKLHQRLRISLIFGLLEIIHHFRVQLFANYTPIAADLVITSLDS